MTVLAITTVENKAQADEVATGLVEVRLAACISQFPIQSTYRWQNKIETTEEIFLLIKTHKDKVEPMKTWIKEHHPYDVPEFLVFEAQDGLEDYLRWISRETISQEKK